MTNSNFQIDLVYLWVDGNDPIWQSKKQKATGTNVATSNTNEVNCAGRYVNNDELRYALRSAEINAPWIRKIFIVTDEQQPYWLNVNHPKIQIIDHKEILPNEARPCFNSSVIEYFLYKIPNLSERFLFANDDMFFNKPTEPTFFFKQDGLPILRLKKKKFWKLTNGLRKLAGKDLGQYAQMVVDSASDVKKITGKFYEGVPHHNIDAYCKADYKDAVENIFSKNVITSQQNRIRTYGDLHRSAFGYYALATNRAHLKFVIKKESQRLLVYKRDFKMHLDKYNPTLFCLNDNQRVKEEDRMFIIPFLEQVFPKKSSFEL